MWPLANYSNLHVGRTYNRVYRDCQRDIKQVVYFKAVTIAILMVNIYFEVIEADWHTESLTFIINYASTDLFISHLIA